MPKAKNPMIKNCTECGESFEAFKRDALVCGEECRKIRTKKQKKKWEQTSRNKVKPIIIKPKDKFSAVKYVCVRCEKEFTAKRTSKYCSDKCRILGPVLTTSRGGRLKHHSPKELAQEVEEYFSIEDKTQITPAGLLLFLGIDRKLWSVYETKPSLKKICNWAQLKMEHLGTRRLIKGGKVADIFFMKNMGWADRKEIDKKEHLIVSNNIDDEQAARILERFSQRRRLMEGQGGGNKINNGGSKE